MARLPDLGTLAPEKGRTEILCCGVWLPYPTPGHESFCPLCRSVFFVSDDPSETFCGACNRPLVVCQAFPCYPGGNQSYEQVAEQSLLHDRSV